MYSMWKIKKANKGRYHRTKQKKDKALYKVGLSPMFKANFVFYFKTVKANKNIKHFKK